jgi:hypothetical protein
LPRRPLRQTVFTGSTGRKGTALPSITLQIISGDHPYTMSGLEQTRDPRVQIDVWGRTYGEAKSIMDALIAVSGGRNKTGSSLSLLASRANATASSGWKP